MTTGSRDSISIHALLAESDPSSTLKLRLPRNFYPRSPCGERPPQIKMMGAPVDNFYPRSPCGERRIPTGVKFLKSNFYPRSPCGERPQTYAPEYRPETISIHALLAESDAARRRYRHKQGYFYPRSPCGERLLAPQGRAPGPRISIHALLAESDPYKWRKEVNPNISIHALLAESDFGLFQFWKSYSNFYPRSPCGERPK